jgi:hypothetical protein
MRRPGEILQIQSRKTKKESRANALLGFVKPILALETLCDPRGMGAVGALRILSP